MPKKERLGFEWHEVDTSKHLPTSWRSDITLVAEKYSISRTLRASSITSREVSHEILVPVLTVGGTTIRRELPWLYDLYRGTFRDIGQEFVDEPLSIAKDDRYALNLNIQRGTEMRYECHVDSNPVEGLLYVTDHPRGTGGELVVANDQSAKGPRVIAKDATRLFPRSGNLIFFDARKFPHFVAPLRQKNGVRIALAMNFYVPSCPESSRPADLNKHLFGED